MGGDLRGRTVLITRPAEDAGAWAAEIERRGGRPVVFPCLCTEPVRDAGVADALRGALEEAGWLVVTSRRGVAAVAGLLEGPLPDRVHVAAVGPATARAAQDEWGRADLVAAEANGAGLARELAAVLARHEDDDTPRVVLAAADRAGRDLEDVLVPAGIEVVRIAVYRTIPAPPRHDRQQLQDWGVDVILLASPSAAAGLVNQAVVPPRATILTIGPTTTEAASRLGLAVTAQAASPGLAGLLEALP